jgi:hypothetical protein
VCGTAGHTRYRTLSRVTQLFGGGIAEPVDRLITGRVTLGPIE